MAAIFYKATTNFKRANFESASARRRGHTTAQNYLAATALCDKIMITPYVSKYDT
jgi:hypothetical protein